MYKSQYIGINGIFKNRLRIKHTITLCVIALAEPTVEVRRRVIGSHIIPVLAPTRCRLTSKYIRIDIGDIRPFTLFLNELNAFLH